MRGSSSWKAFRPPPGPSRSFSLRVLMPGSDHGGQPDQQGRSQVQGAPADQTYTEYDAATVVSATITVSDVDSLTDANLVSATVTIASGKQAGERRIAQHHAQGWRYRCRSSRAPRVRRHTNVC